MSNVESNIPPLAELAEAAKQHAQEELGKISTVAVSISPELQADRSKEVYRLERNPETGKMTVESDLTLEDYEAHTPAEDWDVLQAFAKQVEGKKVVFFNPTMEGGGVAMLRPPLVHLLNKLNVDAHWYVMSSGLTDPSQGNPFQVTKKMHNIAQRRLPDDERLTEDDKALHRMWADQNAEILTKEPEILAADIFVCDDPQPAPMLPRLRAANPNAKLIWRNHIDTSGELMADGSTPQGEVASYLLDECGIRDADAVLTHPVEAFVHPELSEKTYFGPATTDPYDDLNRKLSSEEVRKGLGFINAAILEQNSRFEVANRPADVQQLINPERQLITLVARFDESKGMDHAMKMGVRVRQQMRDMEIPEERLPQVVLVGNGSVDDPSGIPMYESMLKLRREQYADEAEGIIVMRLPHNYAAMNALMVSSDLAMQTSEAEGCETRISDWIEHGKPAFVFNVGGMPGQVFEGKSGHVLDYSLPDHDLERGAGLMTGYLTDQEAYDTLAASTREQATIYNSREYTTTANVIRFMRMFDHVLNGTPETADPRRWLVSEMAVELAARRVPGNASAIGSIAL